MIASRNMNVHSILAGLNDRKIKSRTANNYIGHVRSMQNVVLANSNQFDTNMFHYEEDGNPMVHPNSRGLFRWVQPPTLTNVRQLFAFLTVDAGIARTCPTVEEAIDEVVDEAVNEAVNENIDPENPMSDKATMSSGTFGNYTSAFKWWMKLKSEKMDKEATFLDGEIIQGMKEIFTAYKHDIGDKKSRGVMKAQEGKDPFSKEGIIRLYLHLCKLRPDGNKLKWSQIIFANLYVRLQVATIGRTDNIGNALRNCLGWAEDALTMSFITTKSDRDGVKTNELKHIFASIESYMDVILSFAVYPRWRKWMHYQTRWEMLLMLVLSWQINRQTLTMLCHN